MSAFTWILCILAAARTWRLIVKDDAAYHFRSALGRVVLYLPTKAQVIFWEGFNCVYCFGFWISAAWVGSALAWADTWEWKLIAGALAVNYMQANLNRIGDMNV